MAFAVNPDVPAGLNLNEGLKPPAKKLSGEGTSGQVFASKDKAVAAAQGVFGAVVVQNKDKTFSVWVNTKLEVYQKDKFEASKAAEAKKKEAPTAPVGTGVSFNPAYNPAKLEKRARIYEDTIFNWSANHKVAKASDGVAMKAMDWMFASGANELYAQQEKTLKGLYAQYQTFMKEGKYEQAAKMLDYITGTAIPKFESDATKARNNAIGKAEAAQTAAEVTAGAAGFVFVVAGAVVAAPVAAGVGATVAGSSAVVGTVGTSGAAVLGFGAEVVVAGGLVGGMNGARVAVTKGTVAVADGQGGAGVGKAMAGGYVEGYVEGAKAGAGGVVAGKVLHGAGHLAQHVAAGGGKAAPAAKVVAHGVEYAHHGVAHAGKGGSVGVQETVGIATETGIKYGVVKPAAGAVAGGKKKE